IRSSSYTIEAVMTEPRPNRPSRVGRRWVGLVLCLAIATATAPPTWASLAYPVDLKSCVRAAGYVFAGTVSNKRAEKVPHTIVTRITFSDVVYAKGEGDANSIVLTVVGGKVDDMGVGVSPGLPMFRLGERYIILAANDLGSPANEYLPIVYFNQGIFLLQSEKVGGPLVVGQDLPVIGYRRGHLVYTAKRGSPRRARTELTAKGKVAAEIMTFDTGRRYTEKQFL